MPNFGCRIKLKLIRSPPTILNVSKIGSKRLDLFLVSMLQVLDLPLKMMIQKPLANARRSNRYKDDYRNRRAS
jgi:hypothetical protein